MDKYVCTDSFSIQWEDEDGGLTDKYGTVEKCSIWEISDKIGESDIRLNLVSGNSDFTWIDISLETLRNKFIKKLN